MLDIFSGLRLVIKRRPINIDNTIFRFHWFLTSTILVSFSLIITARQYVGQPIECHSIDKIPETLLNSYCWVQSTFTVPQACNQRVGLDVPYPCIDNTRGREIKMFAYYQWVGIVLFIQGILFHLPYYLWKLWEAGLIRAITSGLRVAVLSDIERCKKKDIVIEYLDTHLGCHKHYALKYFLCELCCLINLFLQLWATDKFFDGQFLNYGLDVIRYSTSDTTGWQSTTSNYKDLNSNNDGQQQASSANSQSNNNHRISGAELRSNNSSKGFPRIDPMTFVFPRITKCTYYDFGSSGDIQKHDAICLLPLNIVNEKIYIALWFWFLILAVLTSAVIVCRLFLLFCKKVRAKFLITRCKLSLESDLHIICKRGDVGDWFLFYMMASNLDPLIMREIVSVMAERLEIKLKKEKEALEGYSASNRSRSDSNRNRSDRDKDRQEPATMQLLTGSGSKVKSLGKRIKSNLVKLLNKSSRLFYRRPATTLSATTSTTDCPSTDRDSPRASHMKCLKRPKSWQADNENYLFGGQRVLDVEEANMFTENNMPANYNQFIQISQTNANDVANLERHSVSASSLPVSYGQLNLTTTAFITRPRKNSFSHQRQSSLSSSRQRNIATMNQVTTLSFNDADRSQSSPYKDQHYHQHYLPSSSDFMQVRLRNLTNTSNINGSQIDQINRLAAPPPSSTSTHTNNYTFKTLEEEENRSPIDLESLARLEQQTPIATAPPIFPEHSNNENPANISSYPRLDYHCI